MTLFESALAAVYRGDIERLSSLHASGLDINEVDSDGRTLLMHAVLAEVPDPAIVEFLLKHGVEVDRADASQRWTALHFAARDQRSGIVRALLEAGATVDIVDAFGNTPLWRAAMTHRQDASTVELLVAHGADPTKTNLNGKSALDIAKAKGNSTLEAALRVT